MFAETDLTSGATYVVLSEASVARTVHVSDVIMVDVDDNERPVGIECAVPIATVDQGDWDALGQIMPEVKEILERTFAL